MCDLTIWAFVQSLCCLTLQQGILYHPLNPTNEGGKLNASILYEMPFQERDEGPQIYNDEEWKAGNSGYLSNMWDKDVPDWKGLV